MSTRWKCGLHRCSIVAIALWYNVPTAVLIAGEFGFAAKPFGPDPSTQLAFADSLDWFDASHLDGFVDEAVEILSQSAWATAGNRLKAIRRGLERRTIEVSAAVEVLRHVQSNSTAPKLR